MTVRRPEGLEREDVGFGDPVDAVGAVERLPSGGAAIDGGVSAQVTEVEGALELDVANRLGRCSRHAFDGTDGDLTSRSTRCERTVTSSGQPSFPTRR